MQTKTSLGHCKADAKPLSWIYPQNGLIEEKKDLADQFSKDISYTFDMNIERRLENITSDRERGAWEKGMVMGEKDQIHNK